MDYGYFRCPVGLLLIGVTEKGLALLKRSAARDKAETKNPLLTEVCRQLSDYFAGQRTDFDLPLDLVGTPFQQRVWTTLQKIPYGETCSYGDVAAAVGNPKACRAVGMANNRNPVSIVVSCHRVIGAKGALVGYGGGLDMKTFLLDLERKNSRPQKGQLP